MHIDLNTVNEFLALLGFVGVAGWGDVPHLVAELAFVGVSFHFLLGFAIDAFWFCMPARMVDMQRVDMLDPLLQSDWPYIVLYYPVLNEDERTMDTTFASLAEMEYPKHRYRVVAIPNANDTKTVAALQRLQSKYHFVEMIQVPPTTDASWNTVWEAWDRTPKDRAYWWHKGKTARNRDLLPKKTRQLIYAFYNTHAEMAGEDFLVNYIDADSCPPKDHFRAAAIGRKMGFDVMQAQNVAGNLLGNAHKPGDSFLRRFFRRLGGWAQTANSFDHMAWDGFKYKHQSNGVTPFWVLGKGLFFSARDLFALGGFNPWITIEDPEVGMRLWKSGKRLGVIEGSLVEEVPDTFAKSITQRKRWVAGFWQSLTMPLSAMGFTWGEKFMAWLIFMPCLSLMFNGVAIPISLWQGYLFFTDQCTLPMWTVYLSTLNLGCLIVSLGFLYRNTWKRTRLVLDSFWDRAYYMLRINPVAIMLWWWFWIVPLTIGFYMFLTNGGKVWQRTEKLDKNHTLVRVRLDRGTLGYTEHERPRLTHVHVDQAAD
jgi:cellulose synthase/poly-beta-1,6-N-acetylglucosamine synthase-like glycosyltransferase